MPIGPSDLCSALLTSMSVATAVSVSPKTLSIPIRFADNQIEIRFAATPLPSEPLVVFIPGGPGISGRYMDSFAQAIGAATKINVGVLNLPNHDQSRLINPLERFRYPEVRQLLLRTIAELTGNSKRELIFVGHSLGALIAMDLAADPSVKVSKMVLVSIPTSFDNAPSFVEGMQSLGIADEVSWPTEAAFSAWWGKLIPLYFVRQPTTEEIAALNSETFWIGNEQFNDGLPSFEELARGLRTAQNRTQVYYLEGERDYLLPQGNFEKVRTTFPDTPATIVPQVGHFPMFESFDIFTRQTLKFIDAPH